MASLAFMLLMVLLLNISSSWAFPDYFVNRIARQDCLAHPTSKLGGHGAPEQDGDTSIRVMVDGLATTSYCPGKVHNIQLQFPDGRLALLTATAGSFREASPGCPNRRAWPVGSRRPQHQAVLSVPCEIRDPIILNVTSAGGIMDNFHQTSLTMTVNMSCFAPQCGSAGQGNGAAPSVTSSAGPPGSATPRDDRGLISTNGTATNTTPPGMMPTNNGTGARSDTNSTGGPTAQEGPRGVSSPSNASQQTVVSYLACLLCLLIGVTWSPWANI